MKPITTWILLADAHGATVYVNAGPGKGLANHLFWTAPPPLDYADQPGRSFSSHGPGSSSMARRDPGTLARAAFAQTLAEELAAQNRAQAYDRLVLVAPPPMLGALRDALDAAVAAKVTAEVAKDLRKTPVLDLPDHLAGVLAL